MDIVNIIIEEETITAINSDGGTHTIEIENDDETLRTYAENIIAMGLMIVDTVPEDDGFGIDDTNFFDDEEDLEEY
tara:strand:- start:1339 stop:1566 length:228 start_codon:yes stop_codon:yes gene_type:complete